MLKWFIVSQQSNKKCLQKGNYGHIIMEKIELNWFISNRELYRETAKRKTLLKLNLPSVNQKNMS